MPETKQKQTTTDSGNSLENFSLDDNEFFGIKAEEAESGPTDVKTVASNIKDTTTKATPKKITTKTDDNEEEEEDEEAEPTFFGDKKDEKEEKSKITKKVATKKVAETEEENEEEEEEEDETDKKVDKKKPSNKKDEKEDEKEENEEVKEDDKDDPEFFTTLAKEMQEKGILSSVKIKKGEEITEDRFFELQDEEVEARVNEALTSFFDKFEDDGKALLKYMKEGGKASTFILAYKPTFDIEEFDPANTTHIEAVVDFQLRNVEGLEGDDLVDRKAWLKEGNREKVKAEKWYEAIKKADDKRKTETLKAQTETDKEKKENRQKFNDELEEILLDTEEVGSFKISKTDQKSLKNFMTKPTVKVGNNLYIPAFNAKLGEILRGTTKEDKKKLIALSKIIEADFNVDDLVPGIKKATTDATRRIKSKLADVKQGKDVKSTASSRTNDLSSYF